jgi:hypothetical protein
MAVDGADEAIGSVTRVHPSTCASTVRPHFRRTVGVSPQTYRETYRPEASRTARA